MVAFLALVIPPDWIDLNHNGRLDAYENPSLPVERRVADLLSRMTVEEKTCQLATLYGYGAVLKDSLPTPAWSNEVWKDGIGNIDEHLNGHFTNPLVAGMRSPREHVEYKNQVQKWFVEGRRLGIPVDFTNEGIKGLVFPGATSFPSQGTIGCTWNPELIRQVGKVTGREAYALGFSNIYSPIMDVCRDQRWGRAEESYGEDPFLVSRLAEQQVIGIQGEGVGSTLKHFAIYAASKGARGGLARTDPQIPWREAEDLHLAPYRYVVRNAHPLGVMASYNDFDGEPVAGSKFFLTQKLRNEAGFNGYVVSDSDAVEYQRTKHRVATSPADAAARCIEAGLNVRTTFTPPQDYILPAREALKSGAASMRSLDQRVSEVLSVKFRLGLFDKPYRDAEAAQAVVACREHQEIAKQAARQSLVLLKNQGGLLPLDSSKYRKIAVVGPLANSPVIGRYGPMNVAPISVLEGIKQVAGKEIDIAFGKGCEVTDAAWPESEVLPVAPTDQEQAAINVAADLAAKSDVTICVLGEDTRLSGESRSRTSLDLTGHQLLLLQEVAKSKKPVVLVLMHGQPLTLNWANKNIPSILSAGFGGKYGGLATAEAIFGMINPGGKTNYTWVRSVGQIPTCFPFKPMSQSDDSDSARVKGLLYPFGHGLSYSTFSIGRPKLSAKNIKMPAKLTVEVDVTNTSNREGDEVVQLYLSDKQASLTPWESVLRGFARVTLRPNETKSVAFQLGPADFAMMDFKNRLVVEPGAFEIRVGTSSTDIKHREQVQVEGKTVVLEKLSDPYTYSR